MDITKDQIEKIKQLSLDFYKKLDFAHNVEHMNKTVKIAEFIAKRENANLEIVRLGAMLHQFHDNIDELKEFLETLNLEPKIMEWLVECVEFRPHNKPPKKEASIEAKVVYDADALQVLGPYGLIRKIACNTKARGKSLDKSIQDARKIEKLFFDSLQTETAKKIIEGPHEVMKDFWKIYNNWVNDDFCQASRVI